MNKKIIITILVVIAVLTMVVGYANYSNSIPGTGNTTITDMLGRQVHVPSEINKVLSTSPTTTTTVYMLAPDKLEGWNFLSNSSKEYVPSKYQNLTVVGGWFGSNIGSYETFISLNPDIVLEGYNIQGNASSTINARQKGMGSISVVGVEDTTNITQIVPSIEFIGKLLGEEQQANKLVSFYDNMTTTVNSTVSNISESDKVKVYYAEGSAGLQTDPSGSMHGQLIDLCGGKNVAIVSENLKSGGKTEVSMEQVLNWSPDVIITEDSTFYSNVYSNSSWQSIPAVQNKRVYLAPSAPFSWFDHPPSANIIIGIPWTAKVLYPDKFQNLNMTSLTKEFYSEFYHVNLTDSDVKSILNNETFNNTQTYNT
ncbi:MAG: ABC transporter substrate-binding protein [Methanobacterium paludis]|nr:ABC transporter substrate-binding protein [Methanobacterium paludis]